MKDVIRVGTMPHSFLHSVVGADSQVTINGIAAFCSSLSHDFAAWPLWRAHSLVPRFDSFAAVKAHLLAASWKICLRLHGRDDVVLVAELPACSLLRCLGWHCLGCMRLLPDPGLECRVILVVVKDAGEETEENFRVFCLASLFLSLFVFPIRLGENK